MRSCISKRPVRHQRQYEWSIADTQSCASAARCSGQHFVPWRVEIWRELFNFAEMRAIDPETYSATPNCHDVRSRTLALLQVKTTGKSMRKSAASLMERKYGVNLREVDSSLRWSSLPSPRDSWQEVTPGQFTHNRSACNLIPAPSVPRYRFGTRYQSCFDFGAD
jgi:hypothetical protein